MADIEEWRELARLICVKYFTIENEGTIKDLTEFIAVHAPGSKPAPARAEREILQAALNWNHEYETINNLCGGHPYWVDWAREKLGIASTWKPKPAPVRIDYARALSTIEYWDRCDLANSDRSVRRRMGELARKTLEGKAGAKPAPAGMEKFSNSCNRHSDCKAASDEYIAKHGQVPGVNFHCHDEECEDCFGC